MDQSTLIAVYCVGTFLVVAVVAGITYWQDHRRRDE